MKSDHHDKMAKALQEIIVGKLRERGFKGSFPHFRRRNNDEIDLLKFQFDKRGGGFVIEISNCSPNGITTHWGEHIHPNKVKAWDIHPSERIRLQPKTGSISYDRFPYDQPTSINDVFEKTARDVLTFLVMAEKWWQRLVFHSRKTLKKVV